MLSKNFCVIILTLTVGYINIMALTSQKKAIQKRLAILRQDKIAKIHSNP